METMDDAIHLAKEKSRTDAEFYRIQRQAQANEELFTEEYIELKKNEVLVSNRKVYFGPNIPNLYSDSFSSDGKDEGLMPSIISSLMEEQTSVEK